MWIDCPHRFSLCCHPNKAGVSLISYFTAYLSVSFLVGIFILLRIRSKKFYFPILCSLLVLMTIFSHASFICLYFLLFFGQKFCWKFRNNFIKTMFKIPCTDTVYIFYKNSLVPVFSWIKCIFSQLINTRKIKLSSHLIWNINNSESLIVRNTL